MLRAHALAALLLGVFYAGSLARGGIPPQFPNVEYANVGGQSLRLDIYVPPGPSQDRPCVVWIHGGGWRSGDKSQAFGDAQSLMARGLVVASVNYRFSTVATWPAQIHDVKGAVRWLRANAPTYRIIPNRIGAMGHSSGGQLTAMLATSRGDSDLEGAVGGNSGFSSAIQAAATMSAHTNFLTITGQAQFAGSNSSALFGCWVGDVQAHQTDPLYAPLVALLRSGSAVNYATSDDPPFYILHGLIDQTVPVAQAYELREALQTVGVPVSFAIDPASDHDVLPYNFPPIYDFLAQVLAQPPSDPAYSVEWATVDGGGGVSTGASFSLIGSIAQPDPGDMVGGGWSFAGGFWPHDIGCSGDFNADGAINSGDVALLLGAWGGAPPPGIDLNSDGVVNSGDLALLLGSWGPCA